MPEFPHAHSGLVVTPTGRLQRDEVPIIAQTGERILSRAQNRAFESSVLGSGVNVTFNVNTIDAKSFRDTVFKKDMQKVLIRTIQDAARKERIN